MEELKYKLIMTCEACPEQYDVFLNDKQVGYLRLRHGAFRCDFPECGEETIYRSYPEGDGMFKDDERDEHISNALKCISSKLGIMKLPYEIER